MDKSLTFLLEKGKVSISVSYFQPNLLNWHIFLEHGFSPAFWMLKKILNSTCKLQSIHRAYDSHKMHVKITYSKDKYQLNRQNLSKTVSIRRYIYIYIYISSRGITPRTCVLCTPTHETNQSHFKNNKEYWVWLLLVLPQ